MVMQIMINFPQILVRPLRPYNMWFVTNLKLIGKLETELWAKEVGEFSIMFMGK